MNPYESTSINDTTPEPHADGSSVGDHKNVPIRFVFATLISACVGFVASCAIDYLTVRVLPYPDHVRDFDWLVVVFPVFAFILAAVVLKSVSYAQRFWLSLGSTVVACLLAFLLVLILGLPFHFSIGGSI